MKTLEIRGARARLGYTQKQIAEKLDMSVHTYRKKESGEIKFTESEKFALARILGLSFRQLDDYLFDGQIGYFFNQKIPIGTECSTNEISKNVPVV